MIKITANHGKRSEKGGALVEYAIAIAILFGTFAVGGRILLEASSVRSQILSESVTSTAPCSTSDGDGILRHEGNLACK